jgi:hypothetical protein
MEKIVTSRSLIHSLLITFVVLSLSHVVYTKCTSYLPVYHVISRTKENEEKRAIMTERQK